MPNPTVLDTSGVTFCYANGPSMAFADVALAPGEQALLLGSSGTGKSTFLNLVAGLESPHSGSIAVNGVQIGTLRGAARDRFRGRSIGMVFQVFNLLQGFSALENILLALRFSGLPRSEHRERAQSLLTKLGVERVDALVDRLSVGQQQRVAVARAVAARPTLVLADEPTASLDPVNRDAALTLLQETCRASGAALLCASHDPEVARRFTTCIAAARQGNSQ
ncbi:MAG: ATP-binding cassette domain-containing protein [Phycisphaerales bacterium]|nr:ATP-binding cassette domain-containing protein [Phycisphaerales bacterium]